MPVNPQSVVGAAVELDARRAAGTCRKQSLNIFDQCSGILCEGK